ncbi:MAG: LuxR C-terminal-related transcriptional regulator [Candidatus Limnocylindria bacterium]
MPATVQIVDDHFLFAEALGSVIRALPGFDLVGIAVTGPQALSMARERQPEIVLLDYHLPGYSAETLLPRIRDVAPGARTIILTSDATQKSVAAAIQAGAAGYLTKDRALDDVVDALAQVAGGRSALTEEQRATARAAEGGEDGDRLTAREVEILRLLARGRDTVAIADDLTISGNTVRTHLQNIFGKLGAHSKLEAVTMATGRGLLA